MRHIKWISPKLILLLTFNDKKVNAMAFWPFVLFKDHSIAQNKIILNHELIHHRQQKELLIIPFHLLYFLFFLYGLAKYRNWHLAYRNVCFEKEAYAHQNQNNYLATRKYFSWWKYL